MDALKLRFAGLALAATASLTSVTVLAMSGPAHAAPAAAQAVRTVTTHDLDLKTAQGQGALHERVQRAAERLCTDRFERMLARQKLGRACIGDTVANTKPQIERAIQRDLERGRTIAARQ